MQFGLSDDQIAAKAALMPVLRKQTEERLVLLNGYAGTGKTYLVGQMVQELAREGRRVLLMAPTHKAAAVLREKLTKAGAGHVDVLTTYSALGIQVYDDGVETHHRYGTSKVVNYDAVVVDEGSMVGEEIYDKIVGDTRKILAPVLFAGDLAQLPPVKSSNLSPIFSRVQQQSCLSRVLRQAGDKFDVPHMGQVIRRSIEENRRVTLEELQGFSKGVVFVKRHSVLDPALAEYSTATQYAIDAIRQGLNAKVLMHSNAAVEKANREVQKYFNADSKKFRVGEPVFFAEQFGREFPNNSEWEVESCSDVVDFNGTPAVEVKLRYAPETVMVPWDTATWLRQVRAMRQQAKEARVSKRMLDLERDLAKLRQMANLRASYAMTVHKSQGSTYEVAVVDWSDLEMCADGDTQDFNRLLYVAITRPSDFLVMVH